jgi:hypothetical protein
MRTGTSITRIIRANVSIVTILLTTGNTNPKMAEIIPRTGVTIIARIVIVGIHTTSRFAIARVIGTLVGIITMCPSTRCTMSLVANIVRSASVSIVARDSIVGVSTISCFRLARIIRTHVTIVTVFGSTGNTDSFVADVIMSTGIAIGAGSSGVYVHTLSGPIIARIIRTHVIIVTVFSRTSYTTSLRTNVILGAGIAVGTRCSVISVHAITGVNITGIIRTRVIIITVSRMAGHTSSFIAMIGARALVFVGTRSFVVRVLAFTSVSVTNVISTHITIVAV